LNTKVKKPVRVQTIIDKNNSLTFNQMSITLKEQTWPTVQHKTPTKKN
jgi:hypothetical protein